MIERIIEWSARNRAIVIAAYCLVAAVGVWAAARLPVDAIPDLSENQVIVFTEWMGRSPEVMENQITYPIVSNLQGLPQVKAVRASSMFGMSFVFVIFEDGTDAYFARNRVLERLNVIQSKLPAGVAPTLGPDGTGVGHVFWYTLKAKDGTVSPDLAELRAVQDWYVRLKLASVEGVAEVASIGGFVRQYQVDADPVRLRAYNLALQDVVRAVQRGNNDVGGKLLEISNAEYFVRGQGYIRTKGDIEQTIVRASGNGVPVRVGDVARVQLGAEARRGTLDRDGEGEAVGGIVVMRSGENAQTVIQRVKERIAQIASGLPEGVEIVASYDRSTLIEAAVGTLERALIEAALVVSVVVGLFLLHWRSIVRILIELPIAVLMAFILMYAFGITSNIMSLGGIILAVGVIVDSSIVLVENSYRNTVAANERAVAEGRTLTNEDTTRIAIDSAKQVGRAIFFSDLIILVSFLPVFLLTGQEGKMFKPLAFTKTFAMLASAVVVITLIPVLMTLLMRGGTFKSEDANVITRFFKRLYAPVLHWVLHNRWLTLGLNLLALVIAAVMLSRTGSEFMPPLDEGSMLFMPVTLPNASLPEVNRILQMQDRIIKTVPEVAHVLGKAGRAETATDNAPVSMIETIIMLKPHSEWRAGVTKKDIVAELDAKLHIPGVRNGWTQPIVNRINMLSTGVRTDIGLKIYGDNLDTLENLAVQAETILRRVDGAADVVADRTQSGGYLDITLRRDAAARYGVSVADVQDIIETAIGGETTSIVLDGRMRFPLRVRLMREARESVDELKQLLVSVPNAGSDATSSEMAAANIGMQTATVQPSTLSPNAASLTYIPLSVLADIQMVPGAAMINSEHGSLRSLVYLNARGRDLGGVVGDARAVIERELKLPVGYSTEWSGQYEHKIRADRTITVIMPLVFALIFGLLYFTLKDPVEAGVVMLSVPFALTGGVYMIFALGYNLSVAVWVGFIALYGVAVETGVVMVVYLHEALDKRLLAFENGKRGELTMEDIQEATVEGSVLRLRPKLMTVLTAMLGLVPIMWSSGTGADVMKPLTAPMIGGLFTSAVHVLVVTPVLFAMMKERALRRGTLKRSRMAHLTH
jgi:copper/silver efflux system protein